MNEKIFRAISYQKCTQNLDEIKEELLISATCKNVHKDILIVVKDQLIYVENCIKSLYENTSEFTLYLWDNASEEPTRTYLESLQSKGNVVLVKSNVNLGFLHPNNELAKLTKSDYIILLNSDTEVKKGWDKAMIGWLQCHPKTLEVGYSGSRLDEHYKGGGQACFGKDIDYVCGWSICISRDCYQKFGLFDEKNLELAYCEDADLSLRIKEAGWDIYALHLDWVIHYENRTISEINNDPENRKIFLRAFQKNHEYMRTNWSGKGLILLECGLQTGKNLV